MTIVLLIVVHLITCLWYFVGLSAEDGWVSLETTTVPTNESSAFDLHVESKNVYYFYMSSARWVIGQLNGRTDEDETRNTTERFLVCFCGIMLAVLARTLFTSMATKTVLELGDLVKEQTRMKRFVNNYFESHTVTVELCREVKNSIQAYSKLTAQSEQEKAIYEALPDYLKHDLAFEVRVPLLILSPIFEIISGTSLIGLRHLCFHCIKSHSVAKDEVVFEMGNLCQVTRFVDTGEVKYILDGHSSFKKLLTRKSGTSQETRTRSLWKPQKKEEGVIKKEEDVAARGYVLGKAQAVSEAALWYKDWTYHGRLVATTLANFLGISPGHFGGALKRFPESYVRCANYGAKFIQEFREHKPSDVVDFELRPSPPIRVVVTIEDAYGLHVADVTWDRPEFYCICRIVDVHCVNNSSSFTTDSRHPTDSSSFVQWGTTGNIDLYPKQSLEFVVCNASSTLRNRIVGSATLRMSQFSRSGYRDELPIFLDDYPTGTLNIDVGQTKISGTTSPYEPWTGSDSFSRQTTNRSRDVSYEASPLSDEVPLTSLTLSLRIAGATLTQKTAGYSTIDSSEEFHNSVPPQLIGEKSDNSSVKTQL